MLPRSARASGVQKTCWPVSRPSGQTHACGTRWQVSPAARGLAARKATCVILLSPGVSEELYELVKKAVRRVDKRAVLVASVEALALENRKLAERWQMLAVFPADFDRRAVAAMWEFDERAALQSINELVQRSMLLFDEVDGRYRVHDLLRDLTRLPLEGEDDAAVERRLEGAAAGGDTPIWSTVQRRGQERKGRRGRRGAERTGRGPAPNLPWRRCLRIPSCTSCCAVTA
jgi:hypothetical protein